MEVLAVKASDGAIRTAFDTCQACYDSGCGYYVQEGKELVCQNCKNRFSLEAVEVERGGCNPVPILDDMKTESADSITISQDLFVANKSYFARWENRG